MIVIRRVIVFLFPLVFSFVLLLVMLRLAYTQTPIMEGVISTNLNLAAFMTAAIGSLLFVCAFWTYNPMAAYGGLHLYWWLLLLALCYVLSGNTGMVFYAFYLPIPELWPVLFLCGMIGSMLLFILRKIILATLSWFMMDKKQNKPVILPANEGYKPYERGYGEVEMSVNEGEQRARSYTETYELPRASYPEMMQGRANHCPASCNSQASRSTVLL